MPANVRLIISAACALFFLAVGIVWANAGEIDLSPVQRILLSLAIGILLALALFQLLRQREIIRESEKSVQRKDLARDEFTANISHEIRTPLSGILGVMHLLKRTELDRNQQRYVDTATNSANMLLNIINDLLAYARMDTGGLPIASEYLDLNEVIEDVTSILAPEAINKGLELVSDIDPNIPYHVKGDALRLRQVIHNLLNNAIKYTDTGLVVVYASSKDRSIEIGVKDTGIGIPPEQVDKLLRTVERGNSHHPEASDDAGLGLNSSRRLVERD